LEKERGWELLFAKVDQLTKRIDASVERESSEFVRANMKGFGPKQ